MQPTKLYAKSRFNAEQIAAKNRIGHDGIEIQLFDEFKNNPKKSVDVLLKNSELLKEDITVVHAPLSIGKQRDLYLEDMFGFPDSEVLDAVFALADAIGEMHKRRTLIIVHTRFNLDDFRDCSLQGDMCDSLRDLLIEYKNTELGIENVPPIIMNANREPTLSNNALFDNVDIACFIRQAINTERVGTVLDICHAKMTQRILRPVLHNLLSYRDMPTLENYFANNKNVIKLIHLATCKSNGFGRDHGLPYSKESVTDMLELSNVLKLYECYNYTCPITLEVQESDYLTCDNYIATLDAVRTIWTVPAQKPIDKYQILDEAHLVYGRSNEVHDNSLIC